MPKALLLQADQSGSGFYRMSEPAAAVMAADPEWDITVSPDADVRAGQNNRTGEITIQDLLFEADLLVLQRPLTQAVHALAEAAVRAGMALAVDIDDDFHNVHPGNSAASSMDPKNDRWHNRLWLNRTLALADVVTVSTDALRKYGHPGDRAVVIPNRLPRRATAVERAPRDDVAVGWTGMVATHPADLAQARGAMSGTDAPFRMVGVADGVARALGISEDRLECSPWVTSPEEYWSVVADRIQVGIAPLQASKFNKAKSRLKPLEYITLGIPCVVSPTPEYVRLCRESGGGVVATSASSWARQVASLASDSDRRSDMVGFSRDWAADNVLEAHALQEWGAAWRLAIETRASR